MKTHDDNIVDRLETHRGYCRSSQVKPLIDIIIMIYKEVSQRIDKLEHGVVRF